MSDEKPEKPKIIVDEDWKSRVQAEREATHKAEAPAPDAPDPTHGQDLPIPEASFSVLVTTLATQALVALGQAPAPDEKEVIVNLPFAKHCVDTLDILAEKTKGHLTPAEDTLQTRFLYELRMLYVAVQNQIAKEKH